MHPNPAFRSKDTALRDAIIEDHPFAAIFLTTPEGARVAHAPIEWADGVVRFHLANGNALTKHLDGKRALIVVQGPEAFVSARWYKDSNQVPTWNYVSYELEGLASQMEEGELLGLLERTVHQQETRISKGQPWTMDKLDDHALRGLLRGITGFAIEVDAIRETVKLAQHKPKAERDRLITGLAGEGHADLADLMGEMPE